MGDENSLDESDSSAYSVAAGEATRDESAMEFFEVRFRDEHEWTPDLPGREGQDPLRFDTANQAEIEADDLACQQDPYTPERWGVWDLEHDRLHFSSADPVNKYTPLALAGAVVGGPTDHHLSAWKLMRTGGEGGADWYILSRPVSTGSEKPATALSVRLIRNADGGGTWDAWIYEGNPSRPFVPWDDGEADVKYPTVLEAPVSETGHIATYIREASRAAEEAIYKQPFQHGLDVYADGDAVCVRADGLTQRLHKEQLGRMSDILRWVRCWYLMKFPGVYYPLRCPHCGSKHLRVTRILKGTPKTRYHKCLKCGKRFKSIQAEWTEGE